VKNWIMEQIVNKMVTKLLSMLDPTGIMAVVNSAIALYSAIQSFIKYLREMLEVVNSFVEGVVDIASGNIATAANYLERTLARAVPIIIGFLANQVGLNGIGHRVGEMIGQAQIMVDQALTWLVNKAVDTAFNLIDRLMGRSSDEPDNRTMEEKQADVDKATTDAQALLDDQSLGYAAVNSKLPAIKQKYRLTKIELVPADNGKYHVDVEINPKKSTSDKSLDADGTSEKPYPIFWPDLLEHPNPALGNKMKKTKDYERDNDQAYQMRQREELFQWLAQEDDGVDPKKMPKLRKHLREQFGVTANITQYTLSYHFHHYRPLFLNGPDVESNMGLVDATEHLQGHGKLRTQEGAPPPPEGMPMDKRDLYNNTMHPDGTWYTLAGSI
jgi:hypothetical protein